MKLPTVSIICAMTLGGVIGNKGTMPWHLRRDMQRFRKLTTPSAVVMGPKTYTSIGRPLKDRLNIVLTTNRKYSAPNNVLVAHTPRQARELAAAKDYTELFVLGGALVYTSFLPEAHHLFLTYVQGEVQGDTHFPHWEASEWRLVWKEDGWRQDPEDTYPTKFAEFERIHPLPPEPEKKVLYVPVGPESLVAYSPEYRQKLEKNKQKT